MAGQDPAGGPMVSPVTGAADRFSRGKRPPEPRPMGNVIGRQPTFIQVNPSRSYPWYGLIVGGEKTGFGDHSIIGGDRFTAQQREQMTKRRIDADTVEVLAVHRNATQREMYWGTQDLPPVYRFECPVLNRRRDGRVAIIAPSGDEVLVEADGWTTPAKKGRLS